MKYRLLILFTLGLMHIPTSSLAKAPNIVFAIADDWGWPHAGAYGDKVVNTPTFDRIAKEGVLFNNAYISSPSCTPSRGAIITGQHFFRLKEGANLWCTWPEDQFAEYPAMLEKAGYHVGTYRKAWGPGKGNPAGTKYPNPAKFFEARAKGKPFCFWFGASDPHRPYKKGSGKESGMKLEDVHLFAHYPDVPEIRSDVADYYWEVQRFDRDLGQLVKMLEDMGELDNTIIVVTGDHGMPFPRCKGNVYDCGARVPLAIRWGTEIKGNRTVTDFVSTTDIAPTFLEVAGIDIPKEMTGRSLVSLLKSGKSGRVEAERDHVLVGRERHVPSQEAPSNGGYPVRAIRTDDYLYIRNFEPERWPAGTPNWQKANFKNTWLGDCDNGPTKTYIWEHRNDPKVKEQYELCFGKRPAEELYDLKKDPEQIHNVAEDAKYADAKKELSSQLTAHLKSFKDPRILGQGRKFDEYKYLGGGPKYPGARNKNQGPMAGMGIMVGELASTNALIQVRLTQSNKLVNGDVAGAGGLVEFVLHPESNPDQKLTSRVRAIKEHDFIARASFTKLKPGTKYVCTTRIGRNPRQLRRGPVAKFKTLPGAKSGDGVKFVVVTGMNYAKFHGDKRIDRKQHLVENNTALPEPYKGPDKHLGYPALETIRKLKPDFFIGTGDNVYYDTPEKGRAETIPQMRQKWHEQFVQPRYRDLFAVVPTYWMIDDHDYRIDDGDNTGDYKPTPADGRRMMLEQLPLAPMNAKNVKTYRTHRVNRDLQIWFPENRMYRSPNLMPDGPNKTIWGKEQKQWLKDSLHKSDATFKLLISPTPMVGPDDKRKTDNHTNIGGFRHERDEFFDWLKKTGVAKQHFYLVCGDRHWQYHAIHPTGMEEFSSGALVDANSRPGRKAGEEKSTDPKGLIKQPYLQNPPSGGFLCIEVTPAKEKQSATLTFKYYDERGKLLYKHSKMKHQ